MSMLACQKSCLGETHLSGFAIDFLLVKADALRKNPWTWWGRRPKRARWRHRPDRPRRSRGRCRRRCRRPKRGPWCRHQKHGPYRPCHGQCSRKVLGIPNDGAKNMTTTKEKTAQNHKIHQWKICQVWKKWEFFQVENPQRFEKLAPQGAAEKATADVWSRVGVNSESWKVRRVGSQCYRVPYFTRWWFPFFYFFLPLSGEMIQFDEHIFQMGWNHQLVIDFIHILPPCCSFWWLKIGDTMEF